MSFEPGGKREAELKNFVADSSLMSERTHLPELDYTKLAIARLKHIKTGAQSPTGRYEALVSYLKQRGSAVDAAEVDRKMRTFFENVISRILTNPQEWDQDQILDGKALMNYLSGIESQGQAPQGGQQK